MASFSFPDRHLEDPPSVEEAGDASIHQQAGTRTAVLIQEEDGVAADPRSGIEQIVQEVGAASIHQQAGTGTTGLSQEEDGTAADRLIQQEVAAGSEENERTVITPIQLLQLLLQKDSFQLLQKLLLQKDLIQLLQQEGSIQLLQQLLLQEGSIQPLLVQQLPAPPPRSAEPIPRQPAAHPIYKDPQPFPRRPAAQATPRAAQPIPRSAEPIPRQPAAHPIYKDPQPLPRRPAAQATPRAAQPEGFTDSIKLLDPAGGLQHEAATAASSHQQEAGAPALPSPMAAPTASGKGAAGSEEKVPMSSAGGWSLRAIVLSGLTAVVAVSVPTLSLVRFHGNPMSQVSTLSLSICSYVFFLLRIWRSRWFFTDFVRLSYAPLLAFWSASEISSATATFVLFFATVWAAGNLGYSLAVHRLRNGTESSIHALPSPSCSTKDRVKELNLFLYIRVPFLVLLWTLFMAVVVNLDSRFDELDVLMLISYFGWVHVTAWLIFVAMVPMHGFPIVKQMQWLIPYLLPWMLVSPFICAVSQILSVLCHFLLMVALVAFLSYNIAIYRHFLWNASISEILEDKIGQVKSDPRPGETPNEAAVSAAV